jgi:hypothetical protein
LDIPVSNREAVIHMDTLSLQLNVFEKYQVKGESAYVATLL